MAVLPILHWPDARLSTRCAEVTAIAFILAYITAHADAAGWVPVSQIREAGAAEGHQWDALHRARKASRSPRIATSNTGPNSSWRIAINTEHQMNETSA